MYLAFFNDMADLWSGMSLRQINGLRNGVAGRVLDKEFSTKSLDAIVVTSTHFYSGTSYTLVPRAKAGH